MTLSTTQSYVLGSPESSWKEPQVQRALLAIGDVDDEPFWAGWRDSALSIISIIHTEYRIHKFFTDWSRSSVASVPTSRTPKPVLGDSFLFKLLRSEKMRQDWDAIRDLNLKWIFEFSIQTQNAFWAYCTVLLSSSHCNSSIALDSVQSKHCIDLNTTWSSPLSIGAKYHHF